MVAIGTPADSKAIQLEPFVDRSDAFGVGSEGDWNHAFAGCGGGNEVRAYSLFFAPLTSTKGPQDERPSWSESPAGWKQRAALTRNLYWQGARLPKHASRSLG